MRLQSSLCPARTHSARQAAPHGSGLSYIRLVAYTLPFTLPCCSAHGAWLTWVLLMSRRATAQTGNMCGSTTCDNHDHHRGAQLCALAVAG